MGSGIGHVGEKLSLGHKKWKKIVKVFDMI